MGRGGQVVNKLALKSDDPSSNPADAYSFSVKILFEKNENKQKEAGIGSFLKATMTGVGLEPGERRYRYL